MKFQFKHVLCVAIGLSVLRVLMQWRQRANRALKTTSLSKDTLHSLRSDGAVYRKKVVLEPVVITADTLSENSTDLLAVRASGPRMKYEVIDGVSVLHNYGHGDGNWMLAPGAAKYMDTLLRKHTTSVQDELDRSVPITIVGAGVIGLFTAYELIQEGYSSLQIITEHFDDLSSHKVGGLLAAMAPQTDENQRLLDNARLASYIVYKSIAQGEHPHLSSQCARFMPSYYSSRADSPLEALVAAQLLSPAQDVRVRLGDKTYDMVEYSDSVFVDTQVVMQELLDYLITHPQVNVQQKKLNSLQEVSVEGGVVIDCAGLGAGALTNDDSLRAVRVQQVMLTNQLRDYQLFMSVNSLRDNDGQLCKQSFYYTPQSAKHYHGVIGGRICEEDAPDLHDDAFDTMLRRAEGVMRF